MPLFEIDTHRCDGDGICALECPARIIKMVENRPTPVEDAEQICIRCGHCVAVCPKQALHLNFLTPEHCLPLTEEWKLDFDQSAHFLRSRRSIRSYKNKSVPRNIFEKALKIASCAPTGSNKQPVKWLIFDQKKDVMAVAGLTIDWMKSVVQNFPQVAQTLNMETIIAQYDQGIDRICRDAPQLVFTYSSNEYGSAAADCHTALAYLELILPSLGLGSCWAGYVTTAANMWPALGELIHLPDQHTCHGALMVGFPRFRYHRVPRRNAPDICYHQ